MPGTVKYETSLVFHVHVPPFSTSLCANVNKSVLAPVSTSDAISAGNARELCGSETNDSRASRFASTNAPALHAASAVAAVTSEFLFSRAVVESDGAATGFASPETTAYTCPNHGA